MRASPSRSESFEGFEGAGSALGVGKLNAVQLLHDSRRHLTTYNGARNEMMPPWLWFNPVTNPDAEGLVLGVPATGPDPFRQVAGGDVDGDGISGTEFDWDAARSRFLAVNRKLDLRRPIEEPEFGVGGVLANWPDMLASKQQFVQDVYYRLARSMLDPFDPNRGVSYLGRDDDAAEFGRRAGRGIQHHLDVDPGVGSALSGVTEDVEVTDASDTHGAGGDAVGRVRRIGDGEVADAACNDRRLQAGQIGDAAGARCHQRQPAQRVRPALHSRHRRGKACRMAGIGQQQQLERCAIQRLLHHLP